MQCQIKVFWLAGLFILFSCKEEKQTHIKNVITAASKLSGSPEKMKSTYTEMKAHVLLKKNALRQQYKSNLSPAVISYLQKEFVSVLVDSIFPYWYGTPWDFNGTTQKPGGGSIACGYFITTVLQDAGLPIKRAKLGQCASQDIINDLVKKNAKKIFSNAAMGTFLEYIQRQGFGLYIVGLDSHVGFLYNNGEQIYFIHAKWSHPKAVVKEVASQSGVLYYSAYKVVGKISDDAVFLKRWMSKN